MWKRSIRVEKGVDQWRLTAALPLCCAERPARPCVWPGRTSVAKEASEVDFRLRRRNARKVCQTMGSHPHAVIDSLG